MILQCNCNITGMFPNLVVDREFDIKTFKEVNCTTLCKYHKDKRYTYLTNRTRFKSINYVLL